MTNYKTKKAGGNPRMARKPVGNLCMVRKPRKKRKRLFFPTLFY